MWIYTNSKPVIKSLIRQVIKVRHPVLFSRGLSSCHACLNSPLISGKFSPSLARSKSQLDLLQPTAKEKRVHGRQSPVTLTQKQLTTDAIAQDGNQLRMGKILDPMAVHKPSEKDGQHRAFIALGSNMGDRLEMIERACKLLEHSREVSILRTSSLWETKAMYVENQANFLNGVCEVKTTLEPIALLDRVQSIERELGRVKTIDKGPRSIDLDILLFDHQSIESERLTVPHKLMLERGFVLYPLCQLIPHETPPEPLPRQSFQTHLKTINLPMSIAENSVMSTQTVMSPYLPPLTPLTPTRKTQVMSILNLTPDSFSDGGQHPPTDRTYLNYLIQSHLNAGATILDIGGQSSRPGAASIGADQELSRILPAIEVARQMDAKMALSVDTYRASVAKKAIMAGAHIVNDISAGQLDPDMLKTLARLGCTVILMHMRGTPETMMEKRFTTYDGDLIATVGNELRERIRAAEAAGIRRWRIILDPGIGFAKNQEHNLEILRRFNELRKYPGLEGLPWVVGVSRKRFIGRITGVQEPKDRTWGTAGAVTAAIQGGADIVRVHDVDEMAKVVRMADAIWRT